MSKKLLFLFVFIVFSFVLLNIKYYEFELSEKDIDSSLIGLTIDGSSVTTFPSNTSGYAIDDIQCDKGASGVWDYKNWGLKIRNVTQSRTKCQINFVSRYSESILNGTDPVLKEGLIPVTIENDGTVRKASLGWEWYDYETKRWANAVILNNETEVYYDGDVIPEEKIESYFVWIPRYKYKIFDMGNYEGLTSITNKQQMIEVIFGTDTTTDTSSSCASPLVSGVSGTCSVGKFMTHPAFLSFGTNGMWVGKFETGYKGATTTSEAQKNENNPNKIQIKPNVYSWRGIQVANAYLSSYNYKREMDSHMMKNTEWGAVAYLQHSRYGSHRNIRINNNASYLTGYAAVKEPTCGRVHTTTTNEECNKYENTSWGKDGGYTVNYFHSNSVLASTTGNYSGVFDMSGGSWDMVMGVMLDSSNTTPCSGRNETFNSGFNGPYCEVTGFKTNGISFPTNQKYYDIYPHAPYDILFTRRILGDATGELGPFGNDWRASSWYGNVAQHIWKGYPWFIRGGLLEFGKASGIFAFQQYNGSNDSLFAFRIVLSF